METLDVTKLEPRLKHATIFQRFDALPVGGEFIIDNDHDPIPLYYQIKAERGEIFNWEYLKEGPDRWKVKISKVLPCEKPKEELDQAAQPGLRGSCFVHGNKPIQ